MAQTVDSDQPQTRNGENRFPSTDPRTGEVVAYHQVDDDAVVRAAVVRAREAAAWWGGLRFAERRRRLLTWRGVLTRRIEELAGLITEETGKPRDDARLECVLVVAHLNWAARHAEKVLRRTRVASGLLMLQEASTVEYQPYGVIGVIGPWNYPGPHPDGVDQLRAGRRQRRGIQAQRADPWSGPRAGRQPCSGGARAPGAAGRHGFRRDRCGAVPLRSGQAGVHRIRRPPRRR